MQITGIFGGTFNPIHLGHLALAQHVLESVHCAEIRFIPSAIPPHKSLPGVTAAHRARMVELAIQGKQDFILDTCEMERAGPSYTIDTLIALQQRLPQQSLVLMMGQDSYQQLPSWHRWQALIDHAHLLVIHRAGQTTGLQPHQEHRERLVGIKDAPTLFAQQRHGYLSYLATTPPDIASTHLRMQLAQGDAQAKTALPSAVWDYIGEHGLYQTASI